MLLFLVFCHRLHVIDLQRSIQKKMYVFVSINFYRNTWGTAATCTCALTAPARSRIAGTWSQTFSRGLLLHIWDRNVFVNSAICNPSCMGDIDIASDTLCCVRFKCHIDTTKDCLDRKSSCSCSARALVGWGSTSLPPTQSSFTTVTGILPLINRFA